MALLHGPGNGLLEQLLQAAVPDLHPPLYKLDARMPGEHRFDRRIGHDHPRLAIEQ
ncbi:hypothetical protein D3C76_1243410 [compost metagenome]